MMRACWWVGVLAIASCSKQAPATDAAAPPDAANEISWSSPDETLEAHDERTECWAFTTQNAAPIVVTGWHLEFAAPVFSVSMYASTTDHPDRCGGSPDDAWILTAQQPRDFQLPTDDGTGRPLALTLGAHQHGYLRVHYLNQRDVVETSHVTITAKLLPAGSGFTPTAPFVTYASGFTIPGSAQGYRVTSDCPIAPSLHVWTLSTTTRKHAVEMVVFDGSTTGTPLLVDHDWENPSSPDWSTDFPSFTSGHLVDRCTYNNLTPTPIHEGPDPNTDEVCMATAYTFPSTQPAFCTDGVVH